jgi:hypothetical protein
MVTWNQEFKFQKDLKNLTKDTCPFEARVIACSGSQWFHSRQMLGDDGLV